MRNKRSSEEKTRGGVKADEAEEFRERGEVEADEDMKRVMRNRKTDKILK